MRIFYIGYLWIGSTSLQRYFALRDLGHIVYPFDMELFFPSHYRGIHTVIKKLCWGPRLWKMNSDVEKKANDFEPDILWIDKGLLIEPGTLENLKKNIPALLLIHYSPDDMMNPDNQTSLYLQSIPIYDAHITTKTYNVTELTDLGAQKVLLIDKCYCPDIHKPVLVSKEDRNRYGGEICFIGSYEKERAQSMVQMALNDLKIRIWGPGWDNAHFTPHPNLIVQYKSLWGDEYCRVISATDINLCFLNKKNRDQQTARSVEIPACGGFMLAERTEEHNRLFKDNKEAVYFSSNEELIKNTHFFINNPQKRKEIAQAGYQRCKNSGYSYAERFKLMLSNLYKNNPT